MICSIVRRVSLGIRYHIDRRLPRHTSSSSFLSVANCFMSHHTARPDRGAVSSMAPKQVPTPIARTKPSSETTARADRRLERHRPSRVQVVPPEDTVDRPRRAALEAGNSILASGEVEGRQAAPRRQGVLFVLSSKFWDSLAGPAMREEEGESRR